MHITVSLDAPLVCGAPGAPHHFDVPVSGGGLGRRLTEMLDWCRENVLAGTWAQHHHSERRKGEAPADFARFYFMDEADAEVFRRRWVR